MNTVITLILPGEQRIPFFVPIGAIQGHGSGKT